MDELLVEMVDIAKSFPGVRALENAQFDLRPGEVHGLVGENGAGKSTLMKILAGIYRRDAGVIRVRGEEQDITSPRAALDAGIPSDRGLKTQVPAIWHASRPLWSRPAPRAAPPRSEPR